MKKYLLIFVVPLLFFSIGCEDEENLEENLEESLEEVTNTVIDENLIGVWKKLDDGYDFYDLYRSFSSNGKWGSWRDDLQSEWNYDTYQYEYFSISNYTNEQTGIYWVEDNILFIQYDDDSFNYDEIFNYSVSGNNLTINLLGTWEKVN